MQTIDVPTPDGAMPVHLHTPDTGDGPWPGVLLFMDAPGIRAAMHAVAARLAVAGYAVALPDLFHRAGTYPPVDPRVVFTDAALRAAHRDRYVSTAGPANGMADTRALLAAMATWPAVAPPPYGVVGYCMGGRLALIAAGTFPDAFAAAASFHAGRLADDTPSSPHRLAARIVARVHVAGAIDDAAFPDDMRQRLADALGAAGVDHLVETRPARHGWIPADMPAHDPVEAERHWRTLLPLLAETLRRGPA